jgi:hypothetical protein
MRSQVSVLESDSGLVWKKKCRKLRTSIYTLNYCIKFSSLHVWDVEGVVVRFSVVVKAGANKSD